MMNNIESKLYVAEKPRPLRREVEKSIDFPVEALGKTLSSATKALNSIIQAPMSLCGQSILAVATLSVQAYADVIIPIGSGHKKPLSCFFVSIAESGERKSGCDSEASKAIKEHEIELNKLYKSDFDNWNIKQSAWDSERKRILNSNKPIIEKESSLSELGSEPSMPLKPLIICPEPTYQGLCIQFREGMPSMGIFSAEGGQFIGGHGMTAENKIATATGLSSLWDGEDIKRVRVIDGTSIISGKRLSMHLMVQPKLSIKLFSDSDLKDQGLLSRVLVTYPESTIGTRMFKEFDEADSETLNRFTKHILSTLSLPLPIKENTQNELCPRELHLSEGAKNLWKDYLNYSELGSSKDGKLCPIKGLALKMPEHACRIAGVMSLIENIQAINISEQNMKNAIELTKFYESEALRLFNAGYIDPNILLAERLLNWLHNNWNKEIVSIPDIYQRGLNSISDAKTARKIVSILVEHGYMHLAEDLTEIESIKRREIFRIIPKEL